MIPVRGDVVSLACFAALPVPGTESASCAGSGANRSRATGGVSEDHRCQLAMDTCLCTVAGSPSMVSMQAARSAREIVNPCGRLRLIAVR